MDYSIYGLRRDPFPHHGSFPLNDDEEEKYASLLIGREELRKKLDGRLKNLREGESSSLVIILGDYGMGKTHCLKFMQYRATSKYTNIIPLYMKGLPEPSMVALLRALVEALEERHGRDFLVNLARRFLGSRSDRIRLQPDIESFLSAMATEKEILALRWVKGFRLGIEERKEVKITSDPDESVARDVIASLLRVIWDVLKVKTLLLVDEVEEVLKYDKSTLYGFYSGLRDLIDRVPVGMMMVLAATPALMADEEKGISALNPALISRISEENVIYLAPLDEEKTKGLIVSYLKAFRTPQTKEYASHYPFTEKSLEIIAKKSKGLPRASLMIAGMVLREGLSRRKRVLDENFVDEVLDAKKYDLENIFITQEPRPKPEMRPEPTPMTLEPLDETRALKLKIVKLLEREKGTMTASSLKEKAGKKMNKAEFTALLREMAAEGSLRLKRVGGGYRVYLV